MPHSAATGAVLASGLLESLGSCPTASANVSSACCLQVAINWCICKGAIPIPGAKSARQAQESAGQCLAVFQCSPSLCCAISSKHG